MEETLLLPRSAQSLHETSLPVSIRINIETLRTALLQVGQAISDLWRRCCESISAAVESLKEQFQRVFGPYLRRSRKKRPKYTVPSRRTLISHRRAAVQAKRKRLELSPDGKLPGMTRAASYALALSKTRKP